MKLDVPTNIRNGEDLDNDRLSEYLSRKFNSNCLEIEVLQFPSGYSNLTYLIKFNESEYVLRRPPFGAKVKSGHDMSREYKILSILKNKFSKAPKPILFCDDEKVIGSPFYIMERIEGVILRGGMPKNELPEPNKIKDIVYDFVSTMTELHSIDCNNPEFSNFARPEGYVKRQVEGWIYRYKKSKTNNYDGIEKTIKWLSNNYPTKNQTSLIHNDYKYDNLVLNADDNLKIKAVLDWEMATVGDPLMDLGTTLGYWIHQSDPDFIKSINLNLTTTDGNPKRGELIELYALKSKRDLSNILFYFIFGLFKIAVIVQQIFLRYSKGFTNDTRFSQLNKIVELYGIMSSQAIDKKKVDDLF